MNEKIKEITEQLQKGVDEVITSEKYENMLRTFAKFTDYSFNNCMLIAMQKPDASLVAGFRKWQKEFNRNVRKGEKAIYIIAPIPHKYKKEVEVNGVLEEKELTWLSYKAIPVFDISQTDGEDLPRVTNELNGNVDEYNTLMEKLTKFARIPVGFENIESGARGYYSPKEDRIAIMDGMSESQTVKTLVHEIAHSIMHRVNSELGTFSKHEKEVQAESVAYTVCSYLGLDTSDYSFGYIAEWQGKTFNDLRDHMELIRKTAGAIIDGIQ